MYPKLHQSTTPQSAEDFNEQQQKEIYEKSLNVNYKELVEKLVNCRDQTNTVWVKPISK